MIRLTAVIEAEGHAPRALTYESNARSLIMGRDVTADFQLPLPTISRHHARIVEVDNVYMVEDLGSTHGTVLNDKKLEQNEKKVLNNGDIIQLTRAKITCAIDSEKVASAAAGEGTQAIAARAVQGILGRLGDAKTEGPYLRVLNGADENTRFPLAAPLTEWTLGRSKDCECVLNDPNVSRRHATLKKDWNGYVIQDLGSKNGVLINESRISKLRRLKDRDEITIGPVKLIFIDPDAGLLDALKDVPGFAVEESHSDIQLVEKSGDDDADHAQQASDSGAPMLSPGELLGNKEGRDLGLLEPDEEPDELAALDPMLLEAVPERGMSDFVLMGGVIFVGLIACLFLYLMLG